MKHRLRDAYDKVSLNLFQWSDLEVYSLSGGEESYSHYYSCIEYTY